MTTTVPHQALYRRWRAQTFAEIVGQEAVVETLRNAVRADRSRRPGFPIVAEPERGAEMAERAGFEPATGFPEPHFQCGAIVH